MVPLNAMQWLKKMSLVMLSCYRMKHHNDDQKKQSIVSKIIETHEAICNSKE